MDADTDKEVVRLPATAEDDAFLADLHAEIDGAEFAQAGLDPAALAPLLAMQHKARRSGYAARFPLAESSILWVGPQRVGHLLVNEDGEELRLVDVAMAAEHRGKGIGTKVLLELCERARAKKVPLRLSVRAANPARRLYERMGFVTTGDDGLDVQMEFRG